LLAASRVDKLLLLRAEGDKVHTVELQSWISLWRDVMLSVAGLVPLVNTDWSSGE
jgi:hypothetical protein